MKRQYIFPFFLFAQIIIIQIISFFPDAVERFYTNGFYRFLSQTERFVFGKIPFSVGDILYGVLIVYLLVSFWKLRKKWRADKKGYLLGILGGFSIFYFFFHLFWGLNYYRTPLFEKMQIQREYTDADLLHFTQQLIVKTNEIQYRITKDKNRKVSVPYSQNEIFEKTQNGYNQLAQQYPFFSYEIQSRKKSLFSYPLTYMGFTGYLNPFTNESQVNDMTPMYQFPMVISHEMAHQIGYASESECNFIGFLAGMKNKDLYFQYAACSTALIYCLDNIFLKDEKLFERLKHQVNPGIWANYQESRDFWAKYDTFIDKGFHAFYDQFLKANQQKEGMESYSKFVDLLINYYRDKPL